MKKLNFKYRWTCKKYKIKAEMKTHKKPALLWNNGGKETQEDYPISAICLSFLPSFWSRVVFLRVLISALFLYFLQAHPYLKWNISETFFPSVLEGSPLCLLLQKLINTILEATMDWAMLMNYFVCRTFLCTTTSWPTVSSELHH